MEVKYIVIPRETDGQPEHEQEQPYREEGKTTNY